MSGKTRVSSHQRSDGTSVREYSRRKPRRSGRPAPSQYSKRSASLQGAYWVEFSRLVARERLLAQHTTAVTAFMRSGFTDYARTQLADYIGEKAWSRIERAYRSPNCTKLAELAAACDSYAACGKSLQDWGKLSGLEPVVRLLRGLTPVGAHLYQAAALLRTAGVVACASRGRPLTSCACLTAIFETSGGGAQLATSVMQTAIGSLSAT